MKTDTPRTDAHMDARRTTYGLSASYPTPEFCFALERENTRLREALGLLLDSLGALSNPTELDGMGLGVEQQEMILETYRAALAVTLSC